MNEIIHDIMEKKGLPILIGIFIFLFIMETVSQLRVRKEKRLKRAVINTLFSIPGVNSLCCDGLIIFKKFIVDLVNLKRRCLYPGDIFSKSFSLSVEVSAGFKSERISSAERHFLQFVVWI